MRQDSWAHPWAWLKVGDGKEPTGLHIRRGGVGRESGFVTSLLLFFFLFAFLFNKVLLGFRWLRWEFWNVLCVGLRLVQILALSLPAPHLPCPNLHTTGECFFVCLLFFCFSPSRCQDSPSAEGEC